MRTCGLESSGHTRASNVYPPEGVVYNNVLNGCTTKGTHSHVLAYSIRVLCSITRTDLHALAMDPVQQAPLSTVPIERAVCSIALNATLPCP